MTLEKTIRNKKGYAISLYRSFSQASDEFQPFISNLGKLLININSFDPHFVILLTDFNAESKYQNRGQSMTQHQRKVQYWKT